MRAQRSGPAALAAAGLFMAVAVPAAASDTIIGDRVQACSTAAKENKVDALAIENCTLAINGQLMDAHLTAATYVNRGTMFMAVMNWGAALADFDQAILLEPTMAEAYVNRGGALVGLRRFKEAEAEISKGLAMMPEEPEKAYGNRALARWSQDDLKGAYEDFKMAQMLKPEWAWVSEQLASFNVETKGVAQAAAGKP
jgi:Flp pilus assembly protein TadD